MADVGFPVAVLYTMEDCYTGGGWPLAVRISAVQGSNVTVYVKLNSGSFSDLAGAPPALNTPAGTPVIIPAGSTVGYLTLPAGPNNATVGANTPLVFGIASVTGGHSIGGTLNATLTVNYYDDDTGGSLRPCAAPLFSDTPVCVSKVLFAYNAVSAEISSGPGTVTLVGTTLTFIPGGTPGVATLKVNNAEGWVNVVVIVTGSESACVPMTLTGNPLSLGCGGVSSLSTANAVGSVSWGISPSGLGTLSSPTGSSNTFTATSSTNSGAVVVTATDSVGQTASVTINVVCNAGSGGGGGGGDEDFNGSCGRFVGQSAISSCDIRNYARNMGLYFGNPLPIILRGEGYSVPLTMSPQSIYALPIFAPEYTFQPDCAEQVLVQAVIHIERGEDAPPGVGTQDPIETRITVNGQSIAFDVPVFNHVGTDPRVYMPLQGLFVAFPGATYTIALKAHNTVAARWAIALRSVVVTRTPYREE